MDKDDQNSNKLDQSKELKKEKAGIIHVLLSQNYAVFFLAVILGVVMDIVIPFDVFNSPIYKNIGLLMIIFGTLIVFWAQRITTSSKPTIGPNRDLSFFLRGPYKYTRNPTNFGLTIVALGLGLIINSLFSVVFIVITYLISKIIFIKRQDHILNERYGNIFIEYKKKVKDWL